MGMCHRFLLDGPIPASYRSVAMRLRIALASLFAIAITGPAFAHSVSGTVYCDQNNSGSIDPGDTGISVFIRITSLDVNPTSLAFTA